ncbi:MAG: OprO/OprP family phosphate-selective porin [Candidatus Aminicenantes bacterium]|nr:OprO/OprP family phosphate-selective porin [Candidatus Aminicenantes bacterium]
MNRKRRSMGWVLTAAVILLTAVLGVRAEAKDSTPVLQWSGYGHVQYDSVEGSADSFRIRRARVAARWTILENLRCKILVETVQNPILLDFQLDWKWNDAAALRLGQFKVPFSMENLLSSSDLDTVNRSNTVEKLCPGRQNGAKGRDIGAALTGGLSQFQYTVALFNGSGINRVDTDSRKDISARLVYSPSSRLVVGLSYYNGEDPFFGTNSDMSRTGLELALELENLFLRGEAILGQDSGIDRLGWYVMTGLDLLENKLRVIARYDRLDWNTEIPADSLDTITLGGAWILSGKTKMMLNYESRRNRAVDSTIAALLAQFQVSF